MKFLNTIVCTLALVALYGCGSGYMSEYPGDLSEACQPGDIVTATFELETTQGSNTIATKGDYNTLVSGSNDIGLEATCPYANPSIEIEPDIDYGTLGKWDEGGNPITYGPDIKDKVASCANPNNCCVVEKNAVGAGDTVTCTVDCYDLDAKMTANADTEFYIGYDQRQKITLESLAANDTVGYITVEGKDKTAGWFMDQASIIKGDESQLKMHVGPTELQALAAARGDFAYEDLTGIMTTNTLYQNFKADEFTDTFVIEKLVDGTAIGDFIVVLPVRMKATSLRTNTGISRSEQSVVGLSQCIEASGAVCDAAGVRASFDAL